MSQVDTYLIKAFEAKQQDLRDTAMHYFLKAASEEPDDIEIQLEVAKSQIDCGLKKNARETLTTATQLGCDDPELLLETSRVLRLAGAVDQALELLSQVSNHTKYSGQATLEAILLLERQHRLDEAESLISHCKASKNSIPLKLASGCLAERRGDIQQALRLYRQVWKLRKGDLSMEAGYRLARLLDRSNEPEEAIKILQACKKIERTQIQSQYLAEFVSLRRAHDQDIITSLPEDWFDHHRSISKPAKSFFVLGHPRSGTTLLAKLLTQQHPITWVDESPTFDIMGQRLVHQKKNTPGAKEFIQMLKSLTNQELNEYEKEYTTRINADADEQKPYLLDKNPGLSTSLPALAYLLPHSAWMFLVRDPRDIALSCYFQRLGNTPLGYCCLTMEGALEAVTHVMSYWKALRERTISDRALEIKYEDLVQQPDQAVSNITQHFGITTLDSDTPPLTPKQPLLESPTYADVEKPVYKDSIHRWKKHTSLFHSVASPLTDELLETWGYGCDS